MALVIYLEFRNLIRADFTKERYYPLGMNLQNWEGFVQWMTGAEQSGLETSFRYEVCDKKDDNNKLD